ncbi:MAG: hypothetical protein ACREYF_24440 [Gammaproteobacteria bacterium]
MSKEKPEVQRHNARKNILAGALVLTPLLATWWVVEFLFNTLSRLGRSGTSAFSTAIHRFPQSLRNGCLPPAWNT